MDKHGNSNISITNNGQADIISSTTL